MIQIGTADYQSGALAATRTTLGTVYRSEPLITRAANAQLDTEPLECPDCAHALAVHNSSGCYETDGEDNPVCLCRMSPDDIGATIDDQEGPNQ